MTPTLADRLSQARARSFVGREPELDRFRRLLAAGDGPAVVVVHGPAGIGKSTLLRRFAALCAETEGVTCRLIDARDLPPALEALEGRLSGLLDEEPAGRSVVLIDAYERLADLDAVVRDHLAPRLPADTLLVLAGQQPPSLGWRTDAGWASLLHAWRLGNLTPDQCHAYLDGRGVPRALQDPAVAFTHGHPLALALVGEVIKEKGTFAPAESADVVRVLIDRLMEAVPTPLQGAALEAAAQVRVVTEPLLGALLDLPTGVAAPLGEVTVSELFGWLRTLPFAESGLSGLYLHDLVREVLARDLRWRQPDLYATYHDRARAHYLTRLEGQDAAGQAAALLDLIYLHPDLRAFLQPPDEAAGLRLDALRSEDVESVVAAVRRHEGADSAALAGLWLAKAPQSWRVVRRGDGQADGAVCLLPITDRSDDGGDPALGAARRQLVHHPPLRPGEVVTLIRFWLAHDSYQAVSPVQSLIATEFARHFLTTAGLAVTILPFAQPEDWEAFCSYADQTRAPDADFGVGDRTYRAYVHDWRTVPPAAWVARLSRMEIGAPPGASPAAGAATLVLGEHDFAAAVRQALRDYTRPDRLRANPLLRCRVVTARVSDGSGPPDQVAVLQGLLKDAAETLAAVPADRRLHRVLVRAYLQPAPTLERAAEVLDLPSSTFRRLLTTAVARVTAVLWHRELDGG
jgi:hypothetical protein